MKALVAIAIAILAAPSLRGDVLLSHSFGGTAADPLHGVSPSTNVIRPAVWDAGAIFMANGRINDLTNTDQGAVFDLGLSWKFKPQSTYTVTLGFRNLDNAILFAGFRTANGSGGVQAQTQGACFAMRVREIAGSDNVGIFQWPGGAATLAPELTYDVNSAAGFVMRIDTNGLTDAVVTVGTAQVTLDLSPNLFRYFFIGYEDPVTATPASDAKIDSVILEGPPLTPLPQLALAAVDSAAGEATITWPSVDGELYMLQGSEDLATWTAVDGSDTAPFQGTGAPLVFVDPRPDARYFYRLTRP